MSERFVADVPKHLHGKYTTYINHKCRCKECTKAHTRYQRGAYRRRVKRRKLAEGDSQVAI